MDAALRQRVRLLKMNVPRRLELRAAVLTWSRLA